RPHENLPMRSIRRRCSSLGPTHFSSAPSRLDENRLAIGSNDPLHRGTRAASIFYLLIAPVPERFCLLLHRRSGHARGHKRTLARTARNQERGLWGVEAAKHAL